MSKHTTREKVEYNSSAMPPRVIGGNDFVNANISHQEETQTNKCFADEKEKAKIYYEQVKQMASAANIDMMGNVSSNRGLILDPYYLFLKIECEIEKLKNGKGLPFADKVKKFFGLKYGKKKKQEILHMVENLQMLSEKGSAELLQEIKDKEKEQTSCQNGSKKEESNTQRNKNKEYSGTGSVAPKRFKVAAVTAGKFVTNNFVEILLSAMIVIGLVAFLGLTITIYMAIDGSFEYQRFWSLVFGDGVFFSAVSIGITYSLMTLGGIALFIASVFFFFISVWEDRGGRGIAVGIYSIIILTVLCLVIVPPCKIAAKNYEGGNLYVANNYMLVMQETADGYMVEKSVLSDKAENIDLVVPEKFKGKPVVSIGSIIPYNNNSIRKVSIPNSIKNLDNFNYSSAINLQYTKFDNGLYLGDEENPYMYFVRLEDSHVTTCKLNENVKLFNQSVFENYYKLEYNEYQDMLYLGTESEPHFCLVKAKDKDITDIVISSETKHIFDNVAKYCSKRESIQVDAGNEKFFVENNCLLTKENKEIVIGSNISVIPYGVTKIRDYAFYNCKQLEGITLSEGLTEIGKYAFYGCGGIKNIGFPDSLEIVGDNAFYECKGISKLMIPKNVRKIGENSFELCGEIEKIFVDGENKTYHSEGNCLIEAKNKALILGCKNSVIPTKGVKTIKSRAFYDCTELTSINIPNSVKVIEENAFYGCSGLENVTLSKSLKTIEKFAFYNCTSLTSINIPNSVTDIGSAAFSGCSELESVTLPKSLKEIGRNTFSGCKRLASINIPKSVTDIDNWAFDGCTGLTSITIPNNVTSIGNYAFRGCSGITSVNIPKKVNSIGSGAFGGCNSVKEIVVDSKNKNFKVDKNCLLTKDGTTLIAGLKNSIIPEGVISIGYGAFYNCSGLTSIVIPKSVTIIGGSAFYGCSDLSFIDIGKGVTEIGSSAFNGCSGLTSITIPNSVTSIGDSAFENCSSIASVIIPDSVAKIGEYAFKGCDNLTIYCEAESKPSSWRYNWNSSNCPVEWDCRYPRYQLKIDGIDYDLKKGKATVLKADTTLSGNLEIPETIEHEGSTYIVTDIADEAFKDCPKITGVTIPKSVISIGKDAFYGCSGLNGVYIVDIASWCKIKFSSYKSNPLYCADNLYLNNELVTNLVIPDSVTGIGNYAFYDCSSLKSITIPNSVTSIGYAAFEYCSGLTSITIPDSVTEIGFAVFSSCSGLTSITISNSLNSISSSAFFGCSSLTNVTIPNSVTSIGKYAFRGCSRLTSITIPNGVTSIGDDAFYRCTSLTSITIPDSVTSIGERAFYDCSGLTSITIPNSVTSIGKNAFYGCNKLTINCEAHSKPSGWDENWNPNNRPVVWDYKNAEINYVGENGIEYILKNGEATLKKAPSTLSGNVEIPETIEFAGTEYFVKSIANETFKDNTQITGVIIPDTIISIGASAFEGCNKLIAVTISNSVTNIGDKAFYRCSGLNGVYIKDIVSWCKIYFYNYDSNPLAYAQNLYLNNELVTNLVIPNSVISIGNYAFYWCTSLTSVTILDSVTSIGKKAFYNCNRLTSVTIPNSVTSIGDYAFFGCAGLTSVTIPNSVTSIGEGAFEHCRGLNGVYINDIDFWCKINFYNYLSNPLYYAHNLYLNNELVTNLIIPNSVTRIGGCAFYECSSLASISIPNSVTIIGTSAFRGCSELTSVTISNNVTSIGKYAFSGCNKLTINCEAHSKPSDWDENWNSSNRPVKWNCNNSPLEIIQDGMCFSLNNGFATLTKALKDISGNVIIPEKIEYFDGVTYKVTKIKSQAFSGCSNITGITIPNSILDIENETFYECTNLRSVNIGDFVSSIGDYAFYGCSNLGNINFGSNLSSIGNYSFYGCHGIVDLVIPNTVMSIGERAFGLCQGMQTVFIPISVEYIQAGAFASGNGPFLEINCEVVSKPDTWDYAWNIEEASVAWGYNRGRTIENQFNKPIEVIPFKREQELAA